MANTLKVATIDTILALHQRKWSIRKIAKELGLHRDTVARHIRLAAQDARAPTKIGHPGGGAQDSKIGHPGGGAHEATATVESAPPPAASVAILTTPPTTTAAAQLSLCEPFRELILVKLERDLTAQRIYQDLVREHGFTGKYSSVRRFIGKLRETQTLPFRRLECAPGDEAQVDFGTGAPLVVDGKRRKTHLFRIVLGHSRKAYSEVVLRQSTDDFLRCLENAFHHFGGVPRILTIDNLKAAVARADWYDADLHPKIRNFCEHYGTTILPTRPRMPRHKGKVERGVAYAQENALKGRSFASVAEQNTFLLDWETTVADTRVHGTTRRHVGQAFAEERPALLPLPAERFPFFHEGERHVHRDGHVEVARAYYSVPPEYLNRTVWARWDGKLVRIFNDRFEQIAMHAQREPGKFGTQEKHIAPEKIWSAERGVASLLNELRRVGPETLRWAEAALATRKIEGVRVVQGLVALTRKHPAPAMENACGLASSYACYRLRTIRKLLARPDAPRQQEFEFVERHPLIRSLDDYSRWLQQTLVRRADA